MIAKITDDLKYIRLEYERDVEYDETVFYFTRKIKDWKFKTKKTRWNGDVLFMSDNKTKIKIGLWYELKKMCDKFGFALKMDGLDRIIDYKLTRDEIQDFCEKFSIDYKSSVVPRDDQIDAVYQAIKYRYFLIDASQNAGKTYIMLLYYQYMRMKRGIKQCLIIEPDAGLVIQTYQEFIDCYGGASKIDIQMCQVHGQNSLKDISEYDVIIGNFQTLSNRDASFFANIDCVLVDEGHRIKAASIRTILAYCKNIKCCGGLSGSLIKNNSADYMTLIAETGPVVYRLSKKSTMDKGYSAEIKIKCIRLSYATDKERQELYMHRYRVDDGEKNLRYEQQLIRDSSIRLKWLISLISKLEQNTLVFYMDVKTEYGKKIMWGLRQATDKEVYYIDGSVEEDLRQNYKAKMEEGTGKVLVASWDTYSTGKSVKNIHNIVLAEGRKSDINISQAIGRGMRKKEGKSRFMWIDIIDDWSIYIADDEKMHYNYMYKWGKSRMKQYDNEEFGYDIVKVDITAKRTAKAII